MGYRDGVALCRRKASGLRAATVEHGTLGPQLGAALMLAAVTNTANEYVVAITSRLARMMGWTDEQLAEAFAYLGLTLFTGYLFNYAQTDLDIWKDAGIQAQPDRFANRPGSSSSSSVRATLGVPPRRRP